MNKLSKVIRARYENGVLKPLEPVELREGEEVIISIKKRTVYGLVELIESLRKETPKTDEPLKVLEEIRK
jgi:predicted DNA-binding antitoxin AbrB/MazE fold protein